MFTLCCFFLLLTKGIASLNITSPPEMNITLGSNSSFILNCTFELEGKENIAVIYWKKKINNNYKTLANFFEYFPELTEYGKYLQSRSKLQNFGNGSTSAVLIIYEVRCEDVGQYQCEIKYGPNAPKQIETYTTVYVQADAEKPTILIHPNDTLVEHEQLTLSCSANVGTPEGLLALWTKKESSSTWEHIKNINDIQTNTCVYIANLTKTYNLTRKDNGTMFRCSSQNKYMKDQDLTTYIGPIKVLYGTTDAKINATNFHFSIDDIVNLKCISDGNPSPNYTWKFNHTEIDTNAKYNISVDKTELSFTVTNITDSGYYQCVASNIVNGKLFNSSSNVTLTIQKSDEKENAMEMEQTCLENSCFFLQSCISRNGNAICSNNIWAVIATVFIILTLIFGTTCVSLIFSRKTNQRKIICKNGLNDNIHVTYTREKFEDFGGYADPKDVTRPEKGQIKLDKDGRDNPYADPVDFQTQYAVVQKTWETPAKSSKDTNSSDTSNLLNNTDSSNTGNPSSSTETTNLKNLSSDEKTSASTETSETIPKPPNVYDGAWV
uniref:Ig-like domain-containing protein n=1 Tax=Magallana gigas TaxID=29159 RepID=A0A8W8NFA9_MAGGI|nr:cell adhesion molecule 3 isoform X2 [Crassostrea gigas]